MTLREQQIVLVAVGCVLLAYVSCAGFEREAAEAKCRREHAAVALPSPAQQLATLDGVGARLKRSARAVERWREVRATAEAWRSKRHRPHARPL